MDSELKFEMAYWSLLSRTGSNEKVKALAKSKLDVFFREREVFLMEEFYDRCGCHGKYLSKAAAALYKEKSGSTKDLDYIQHVWNLDWEDPILIEVVKELKSDAIGNDAMCFSIHKVKGKYKIGVQDSDDMNPVANAWINTSCKERRVHIYSGDSKSDAETEAEDKLMDENSRMTRPEIMQVVKDIISILFPLNNEEVTEDTVIRDLPMSSSDSIEVNYLFNTVEKRFVLSMLDRERDATITIKDLVNYIKRGVRME